MACDRLLTSGHQPLFLTERPNNNIYAHTRTPQTLFYVRGTVIMSIWPQMLLGIILVRRVWNFHGAAASSIDRPKTSSHPNRND
jgi:hypothetical protein